MSTAAQVGKREYRAEIARLRNDKREVRMLLERIVQNTNSNMLQALAGRIALLVIDEDEAVNRLDEIGKTLKDNTKSD